MLKALILVCVFLMGCLTVPREQRAPLDLEQEIYIWSLTDFCAA